MPRFAPLAGLAALAVATLVAAPSHAAPITYAFAGEITLFDPPTGSAQVPPVAVPDSFQFFSGSFIYDPAPPPTRDVVVDPLVAFLGGTTLSAGPATTTDADARLGDLGAFHVLIGAWDLTISTGVPSANSLIVMTFERSLGPGDTPGMLPATLDRFTNSTIGIAFGEDIYIGAFTRFAAVPAAAPEPGAIGILGLGLIGLGVLQHRRRRGAHHL